MGPFLRFLFRKFLRALLYFVGAYILFLIVFFAICSFSKPDASPISDDSDLTSHHATIADFGANHRPLDHTYYTFPEWFIVWSYEERANFLDKSRPPSDFPYFGSIYQYWHGYCFICSLTHQRKQGNFGDHVMLVAIGTSFSLEYTARGIYENTIGRLTEFLSGHQLTEEDAYAAGVARDYANFATVRPAYEFHFARALKGLWTQTPFLGPHQFRKLERKTILTLDYGLQSLYSEILQLTSHLHGAESTETYAAIDNASESVFREFPHIRKIKDIAPGEYLVSIPRYQEFTELAVALAKKNVHFAQIAGNSVIVVTSIAQGWRDYTPEERALFTEKVLARDVQRVAMECRVTDLHLVLNDIASRGYLVEHIYDY